MSNESPCGRSSAADVWLPKDNPGSSFRCAVSAAAAVLEISGSDPYRRSLLLSFASVRVSCPLAVCSALPLVIARVERLVAISLGGDCSVRRFRFFEAAATGVDAMFSS